MKPATLAARHTIEREHAIKVAPRLIAEWEYNRFFAPTVTVTPDQTTDAEWEQYYGNTASMVQPFRPIAGIAKARADDGVIPLGTYRDTPLETRYYPSSEYDLYMYWSSLQRSELTTQADGSYPFDTPVVITAMYPQQIAVNKIVVGFELGYCKPKNTSIQVTTDGTTWTTIADNPAINGEGTATLWRSQFGWSDTPDYDWPIAITGVRLNVYSVDTAYCHLDVLQISPRLENDLSDFIVNYESDFEVSSPSFIAPLGKASSNQAKVTLSNIDGRFNNENPQSLYYQMIEKKVRFTMDIGVDTTNQGGTGLEYIREFTMWTDSWGAGNDASTVDVTLKDSSVILQEQNMPPVFLENYTVGGIVMHIMDRIGMTNYIYTKSETEMGQVIPFYWPSDTNETSNPRWGRLKVNTTPAPNTTIWDEISALAESTQTALFFDENDQLQIVARKAMYNNNKPVNWNLDAVPNGTKLPDVVQATSNFDLTTNQVEVTYRPAAVSSDNNGFPIMATVWQPTAPTDNSVVPDPNAGANATDIVLRAGVLTKDLTHSGTDLWMSQATAIIWPYESDVNIEGECLHYKGKEYAYYDANNVLQKAVVSTLTDQQNYDALNPYLQWKNAYTGRFVVTQRGLYGSIAADHLVSKDAYTAILTNYANTVLQSLGDGYITQHEGYVTQFNAVVPSSSPAWNTTYMLRKHTTAVTPILNDKGDSTVWYGAKIRFPSGYAPDPTATTTDGAQFFVPVQSPSTPTNPANPNDKPDMSTPTSNWHLGGLFFAGDNVDAGYYLEITSTGQLDGWEQRQWRNEICLIGMPGNGAAVQLKGTNYNDASGKNDSNGNPLKIGNMGFQVGILEDTWYQVDVSYTNRASDGHDLIGVYINGVVAGTWDLTPYRSDATSDVQLKTPANMTNAWRFGTHVRGPSMGMDIEYLYAVAYDETQPWLNPDQTAFLDLVNGGYASGFVYKNIKYYACNINPTFKWPYGQIYTIPEITSQSHMILDEYGPVVHEMRLFDVNFDTNTVPAPASFLYVTNPQVEVISYLSDAFGAEFMLANASRDNVIVNGEDDITAGASNPITQSILIYGRSVYTASNDSYLIKKDDDAIRRQGLIRTQITTRYVQTDEMAADLGDWILSLWATGVDEVDADLFGNPLLQIGDLVTMNYPVQGMAPSTHQYFVTSIINTFDSGYKSSVKLRRAKIDGSVSGSLDG